MGRAKLSRFSLRGQLSRAHAPRWTPLRAALSARTAAAVESAHQVRLHAREARAAPVFCKLSGRRWRGGDERGRWSGFEATRGGRWRLHAQLRAGQRAPAGVRRLQRDGCTARYCNVYCNIVPDSRTASRWARPPRPAACCPASRPCTSQISDAGGAGGWRMADGWLVGGSRRPAGGAAGDAMQRCGANKRGARACGPRGWRAGAAAPPPAAET